MARCHWPPVVDYPDGMALITITEAARRLGRSPITLRSAIQRGRMVGHKYGRDWLVEESEVRFYELQSLGRVGRPKGYRPVPSVQRGRKRSPGRMDTPQPERPTRTPVPPLEPVLRIDARYATLATDLGIDENEAQRLAWKRTKRPEGPARLAMSGLVARAAQTERRARDTEMAALRAAGHSLAEIGAAFGVSRQRVSQITNARRSA